MPSHPPGPGRGPAYDPHAATLTVGGYRLLRVVGEGGMGVVHLGLDDSGRAAAVKVLRPHVAADPEARARLAREVRTLVRVRHRRVAEVLDAGLEEPLPYIAMRYVPGDPLDAVVREHGPLTGELLEETLVGLFEAVSAIHAAGVVHRDLKPGNVLLLDGSPVVIDFGIARALDDVALTSTGLMVGTPGYLAPEVLDGDDVGPEADWWGWGAVSAFAATGRPAFGRGPMEAVFDRVRRGVPDLDGVEPRLARLLAAALRPEPELRPSPEELADGIAGLTGRRPEQVASEVTASSAPAPVRGEQTRQLPRPVPAAAQRPPEPSPGSTYEQTRPGQPRPDLARPEPEAERTSVLPVVPAPSPGPVRREPPPPRYPPNGPAGTLPVPAGPAPYPAPAPYPGSAAYPLPAPYPAHVPGAPRDRDPSDADPYAPPGTPQPRHGPPPAMRRRPWLTLVAAAAFVAVAAVSPLGAGVLALGWSTVARASQWTRVAAAMRRLRTGRLSGAAVTRLVAAYPFRLVGAALSSAAYLLLSLLVLSPVLLVAAWALVQGLPLSDLTLVRTTLDTPVTRSVLAVLAGAALWLGPGGRAVRDGSRALTDRVARHRNGHLVLVSLGALVVVAALVVLGGRVG